MLRNIGEGIAIFGIMLAVALTKNYWLLFFTILPMFTWLQTDKEAKDIYNNLAWQKERLEIDKLKEEVRLLKGKK